MGSEDLTRDPAFATNPDRVQNREALAAVLQEKLMTWRKAQCLAALEQTVVPAGPIDAIE